MAIVTRQLSLYRRLAEIQLFFRLFPQLSVHRLQAKIQPFLRLIPTLGIVLLKVFGLLVGGLHAFWQRNVCEAAR